jgi:tRNA pseudouridine55 synthase
MNGLLLIDKPKGITSHDVVDRVRRIFNTRKVGHTGTLDPAATGLLLICVGKATRLASFLQDLDKTYQGVMVFGLTTSSMDEESEILEEKDASSLNRGEVENIFARLRGKITQTPPVFSAVHWKGERLYRLAREGLEPTPSPRQVEIYVLSLLDFIGGHHPQVKFKIHCSKGTYIRSLCAEVGRYSGYGAYQASLRRTQIGPFLLEEAKTLEDLEKIMGEDRTDTVLIGLKDALPHLPLVKVKKEAERVIGWGRPLYISHLDDSPQDLDKGDRVRLCAPDGRLLAVAISLQKASHFSKDKVGFKYLRVLI